MASQAQSQIINATNLAALLSTQAALLGNVKLIVIDGPAGSGKSTLANLLAKEVNASVIHMDEIYNGWEDALTANTIFRIKEEILLPLSKGKSARYRKFDWGRYEFGPEVEINPEVLILEGVGAAASGIREYASSVIWIEVPAQLGLQRVLDRDGIEISEPMVVWQKQESIWHKTDKTRAAADLILSGERSANQGSTDYLLQIQ